MELSRRRLLLNSLFGAGMLGLRSLASGIPISILANPRRAIAAEQLALHSPAAVRPQFVVFCTSADGDPLNANAPGSYANPLVGHPADPSMAPTKLTLAGQASVAARPWSLLPQAMLDCSCFFHHGTSTVIHSDESNVLALGGAVAGDEMFASLLASRLAPALGTVQAQPIVLGPRTTSEDLFYQGSPQPILSPSILAEMLAPPAGPLGSLAKLRDADLDRLNAIVRTEGVPGMTAFVDRYAASQAQARALSDHLLSTLASIRGDGPDSQVTAAVTLIRMNVAPVVSIHIPFGTDNHTDAGLAGETAETISGVATLGKLWEQLAAAGIQDQVSFLSLNVFGRTLLASTSADGRQHNGNHHVALMFGAPFRGGVIGGIEAVADDLGAMSISSATGAGVPHGGGDIPFSKTMQAMGSTFGKGVGAGEEFVLRSIRGGAVVHAALAGG